MRRTIRDMALVARVLLVTVGPFLLLAVVLLFGANHFLKPTPPTRVVLATGSDQSQIGADLAVPSLFFVGLLLFAMTLGLNLVSERFVRRVRQAY